MGPQRSNEILHTVGHLPIFGPPSFWGRFCIILVQYRDTLGLTIKAHRLSGRPPIGKGLLQELGRRGPYLSWLTPLASLARWKFGKRQERHCNNEEDNKLRPKRWWHDIHKGASRAQVLGGATPQEEGIAPWRPPGTWSSSPSLCSLTSSLAPTPLSARARVGRTRFDCPPVILRPISRANRRTSI